MIHQILLYKILPPVTYQILLIKSGIFFILDQVINKKWKGSWCLNLYNNDGYDTNHDEEEQSHNAPISCNLFMNRSKQQWEKKMTIIKSKWERDVQIQRLTCLPISLTSWEAFLIEKWIESRSLTIRLICSVWTKKLRTKILNLWTMLYLPRFRMLNITMKYNILECTQNNTPVPLELLQSPFQHLQYLGQSIKRQYKNNAIWTFE